MKLWIDASTKKTCAVFETGETIVLPLEAEHQWSVNEAEYQALISALIICKTRKYGTVDILSDSQVLVYQMTGRYRCKAANLKPMRTQAYRLLEPFDRWTIGWTPRDENQAGIVLDSLGGS